MDSSEKVNNEKKKRRIKLLERFKFFLAGPSLIGFRISKIFRIAKKVGYDGVEVLLTKHVIRNLDYVVQLAKEIGLELTFHQPWEGSYSIANRVLRGIEVLPKNFQHVSDLLPTDFSYPVVLQSWRLNEAKGRDNYMVQIIFDPKHEFENPPLEILIEEVLKHKIKIAFDIWYYVEYFYGGMENVPRDEEEIFEVLIRGWSKLKTQVKEIHYYNFELGRGLFGKNLFFGGILPIDRFMEYVGKSGWSGTVVFEVNPLEIYPLCLFPGSLTRTLKIQRKGTKAMTVLGVLEGKR